MAKGTNVVPVNDDNFETEVLGSDIPVLVDFGGAWCGPCKVLAPIVEKIADDHVGKLKVVAIDVDDAPNVAKRYGVRGVPTVIGFDKGQEKGKVVGITSREKLLSLV